MATQKDVIRQLEKITNDLKSTLDVKGKDYAGTEDTFKSFKNTSAITGVSVEKVILTRMADKFTRLSNVLDNGTFVGETVQDTVNDLIGYSVLLSTYLEEEEEKMKKSLGSNSPNNEFFSKRVVEDDDGYTD